MEATTRIGVCAEACDLNSPTLHTRTRTMRARLARWLHCFLCVCVIMLQNFGYRLPASIHPTFLIGICTTFTDLGKWLFRASR
jgi:hypothetical protein